MRVFYQRWLDDEGTEMVVVDGSRRRGSPPPGLVRRRTSAVEHVRNGVGLLMRRSAQLLLLAPILIVPKLILPRGPSDLLTVGFVIAVVAFFTLLALYFLISFLWWGLRARERRLVFSPIELDENERRALPASEAAATPGSVVRVTGRVVPLSPTDVVLSAFAVESDRPWRLVELVDFAVVPSDGIPAVVRAVTAPLLALPERHGSFREHAARFSEAAQKFIGDDDAQGTHLELLPGDRIELIGAVARVLPNADAFDLDGKSCSLPRPDRAASAAYRGAPAGPALLVGADESPRIVIKSAR